MTAGEAFVADLLDAMPTPEARMRLTARLAKYAGATIYLPAESKAGRRINAARNMLDNCMPPADVANALRERFSVSGRQAQRDVNAARQMSPGSVASWRSNRE